MLDRLRRLLPHTAILICDMYIVFYLIDRVNKAMNFIDNGLTKGLLLALCLVGLFDACGLRRAGRRAGSRGRSAARRSGPAQDSTRERVSRRGASGRAA